MKIERQFVESIDVGDRLRAVDDGKVMTIAESMKAIGLLHPITVSYSADDSICTLVGGAHRLAAAKLLGWDSIDTVEIVGNLAAQLAEIDENLCRSELTPAEFVSHVARRKEIWAAMRVRPESENAVPSFGGRGNIAFAADTARAIGVTKRSLNQNLARAEALGPDIHEIVGTSLDKGVELDALARLPEPDRHELVRRAKAGEAVSARKANADVYISSRADRDAIKDDFTKIRIGVDRELKALATGIGIGMPASVRALSAVKRKLEAAIARIDRLIAEHSDDIEHKEAA
jgi:hypothetical protein